MSEQKILFVRLPAQLHQELKVTGGVRARGPRPGARGWRRARPEQNLASVRSGAGDRAAIGHQDAPPRGKGRERRPRTPPERGHQGDRRGAEPPLASSNVAHWVSCS